MRALWKLLLVVCLVAALAGCKQSLYSKLTEQEANEIIAALARVGIGANKVVAEKHWGVEVSSGDLPAAVEALDRAGLPRHRYATLGDMFKREGIVSTPTEERVRFIHGVSQELSATLSTIDGVVAARVHIVMPQNDPLADRARPSSASVFIKHRADVDLLALMPSIKSLVVRSIEGLVYDNVFVSLVPADPAKALPAAPAAAISVPLFGLKLGAVGAFAVEALFTLALALLVGLAGYVLMRHRDALRTDLARWRGRVPAVLPPPLSQPLPQERR